MNFSFAAIKKINEGFSGYEFENVSKKVFFKQTVRGEFIEDLSLYFIWINTHYIRTEEMRKGRTYIYDQMRRGFSKRR